VAQIALKFSVSVSRRGGLGKGRSFQSIFGPNLSPGSISSNRALTIYLLPALLAPWMSMICRSTPRTMTNQPRAMPKIESACQGTGVGIGRHCHMTNARTLQELSEELPPPFARIHRSHIVNLRFAQQLRRAGMTGYKLRLATGEVLPVGRLFLNTVLHLSAYLTYENVRMFALARVGFSLVTLGLTRI
jgi:hypothetical protein